jgi:hypothetical protein
VLIIDGDAQYSMTYTASTTAEELFVRLSAYLPRAMAGCWFEIRHGRDDAPQSVVVPDSNLMGLHTTADMLKLILCHPAPLPTPFEPAPAVLDPALFPRDILESLIPPGD